MRILTYFSAASVAACAIAASACAPAPAPTSTLTGTIDQASFPAPVTRLTVAADSGAITHATVSASGAFSVPLAWGTSYRFLLSADGKGTPLVVRTDSATGRLETELSVSSGGATVDVGAVRFWAGTAPTKSARSLQGVLGTTTPTRPTSTGVATAVCADEDGDTDHAHGGGTCKGMNMGHDGDGAGATSADDHDADDVTPATPSVTTDATATEAVGIPTNALPASIGCAEHEHHHDH